MWNFKHRTEIIYWSLVPCRCFIANIAKSLQSCLTLCDAIDGSLPGSPISGILQARTLEWVAISFSNAWKWKVKVKSLSPVWPSATPWTAGYQAPLSMGFSRQEYWSGVPLPSPRKWYRWSYLQNRYSGLQFKALSSKVGDPGWSLVRELRFHMPWSN